MFVSLGMSVLNFDLEMSAMVELHGGGGSFEVVLSMHSFEDGFRKFWGQFLVQC